MPRDPDNRGPKNSALNDRLGTAAKARLALLEKFKARPAADDPAVVARNAERQRIAEERDRRTEARAAEKMEAEKRSAEEAAQRILDMKAAEEAEEAEKARLLIEQKAARDARYAARKQRK